MPTRIPAKHRARVSRVFWFVPVALSVIVMTLTSMVPVAAALDCGCEGGVRYRLTSTAEVNDFTCPSGTRTVINDSWAAGGCSVVRTGNPALFVSCVSDPICSAPTLGTISVSANIGGASWTLVGPATQSGSGLSGSYTAMPPGVYTIIWGSAPGYGTPSSDSQTLTPGGVLTFTGNYGLPTVNVFF